MFALINDHRVTMPGRYTRKFKARRPCTDHQHTLTSVRLPGGTCAPNTLPSDNRIVGALHTTAAHNGSPTIVCGDAPPDVPFSSLFDLCEPLLVGDHLTR